MATGSGTGVGVVITVIIAASIKINNWCKMWAIIINRNG